MPKCNKHNKFYPDQWDRCEDCDAELMAAIEPAGNVPVVDPSDLRHTETLAAIILSGWTDAPGMNPPPDPEALAEYVFTAMAAGAIVAERYAVEVANAKQGT